MLRPFNHWLLDAPLRKSLVARCRWRRYCRTRCGTSPWQENKNLETAHSAVALRLDPEWCFQFTSKSVRVFVCVFFRDFPLGTSSRYLFTLSLRLLQSDPLFSIRLDLVVIIDSNFLLLRTKLCVLTGWLQGKTFPQTAWTAAAKRTRKIEITWTARRELARDKYEIPITKMCRSRKHDQRRNF